MNWVDVVLIAAATSVVTTIVAHAVPAIGGFLWRQAQRVWHVWPMLRNRYRKWRYWKRFGPRYDVIKKGVLSIEKTSRGYEMVLPITLIFENKDERKAINIDNRLMQIGFDTKVKDGRTEKYVLTNEKTGGWLDLAPNEKKEIRHEFIVWNRHAEPVLGDIVHCYWIKVGRVQFYQSMERELKPLEPFDVRVDKSKLQSSDKKV